MFASGLAHGELRRRTSRVGSYLHRGAGAHRAHAGGNLEPVLLVLLQPWYVADLGQGLPQLLGDRSISRADEARELQGPELLVGEPVRRGLSNHAQGHEHVLRNGLSGNLWLLVAVDAEALEDGVQRVGTRAHLLPILHAISHPTMIAPRLLAPATDEPGSPSQPAGGRLRFRRAASRRAGTASGPADAPPAGPIARGSRQRSPGRRAGPRAAWCHCRTSRRTSPRWDGLVRG